jgi:hypothetical protein
MMGLRCVVGKHAGKGMMADASKWNFEVEPFVAQ